MELLTEDKRESASSMGKEKGFQRVDAKETLMDFLTELLSSMEL